ncbi:hypothetical protein BS78_05G276000 [Paspalum vaginatum]|nr:hypothetical protein BS78_05G276000 [Paspalum vaginatum]
MLAMSAVRSTRQHGFARLHRPEGGGERSDEDQFWSMPSGILWPASLKARGGEFGKFYSLPASTMQGLVITLPALRFSLP